MPSKEELKELQSKSLEEKIQISIARIIEWYENWGGQVYVSFSGGKDSTVLLDLVRRIYPDVPAVFVDTGLEFPEIREFVKSIDNVVWLKPKMNFVEVIKKYGYPLISKEVSRDVGRVQKNKGINSRTGEYTWSYKSLNGYFHSIADKSKWKFLVDCPFFLSNECCTVMKKRPLHDYEKQTKQKSYIGTMTYESNQRKTQWLQYGCNAFNIKNPSSKPLSFWTEQDILTYIKKYNIPYASVYGKLIENNNKLEFTGCERTGCVFCGFGCQLEKSPNRFQKLAITHPQLYDYCMRGGKYDDTGHWIPDKGLGMAKVLDAIGVEWWNTEEQKDKYREEYMKKENFNESINHYR